jgi:hypothetical protein
MTEPILTIPSALDEAAREIESVIEWNRAGRLPSKIGFARPLPQEIIFGRRPESLGAWEIFSAPAMSDSTGRVVWTAVIKVTDAYRFRLHLTKLSLPAETRFWIYGKGEEPMVFGLELESPTGDLWTPGVEGDTAYLQVETRSDTGAEPGFTIGEVAEVVPPILTPLSPEATAYACLEDATCVTSATFDSIGAARKAVAHLEFLSEGTLYACTGTLLTDRLDTFKPYLLTAHHCISTRAEAASLDAFWDYETVYCGGPAPNLGTLQRTHGSTLLATGTVSDFTFLLLTSLPSGRYLMGWDPRADQVTNGTRLYRVSHPAPLGIPFAQQFSESLVDTTSLACLGADRPQHMYSLRWIGGTFGGSSGSASMLAGGYVVGQLHGGCGGDDGCDNTVEQADGAFATTYQYLVPWLEATSGSMPVASFTYAPRTPVARQGVLFTDTSTGSPTSWSWDFGDRTGSADQNPSKVYEMPGTYNVTLTSSNSSGSDPITVLLKVEGCFRCTRILPPRPTGRGLALSTARP